MDFQTLALVLTIALLTAVTALFLVPLLHKVKLSDIWRQHVSPYFQASNPAKTIAALPAGTGNSGAAKLDEPALLRNIAELSPVLSWQQNPEGQIIWANKAYLKIAGQFEPTLIDQPLDVPVLFGDLINTENAEHTGTKRQSISIPGQAQPWWFEVSSVKTDTGANLNFAVHANAVVRAEDALRNFVQTLTKTFAHLPTGLAIFDRARQLALFNPALSDLTTISPEWLSGRPTLFSFLDKLRENRQMPEPKNYPDWRRKMTALEQQAVDGTYCEDWPLPTGQTYRVTGRPHPEGAVAFLFEDISASISLQRRIHTELEMCQSVIDSFQNAIVVFEASGDVTMSNDAFSKMWGFDPSGALGRTSVIEVTKHCQSMCAPSPIWGDLRDFVDRLHDRAEWDAALKLQTGVDITIQIYPLPNGATLCSFAGISTVDRLRGGQISVPERIPERA